MKQIRIVYKSGAVVVAPYSSKFYGELADKMGTDAKIEHPSAVINVKDVQGIVFENIVEA